MTFNGYTLSLLPVDLPFYGLGLGTQACQWNENEKYYKFEQFMHWYSHNRMDKDDKIAAIKISWENFTSYCSFGTIFAVDNLYHEILPQTKENMWIENEKNLISNNIYFVKIQNDGVFWGII